MVLLSVVHTATVFWDVYKVSTKRAQRLVTPKSGETGRSAGAPHSQRKAGAEQIKASRLLAAGRGGAGSPVPGRAATIIREAGEIRLLLTPVFWPIT